MMKARTRLAQLLTLPGLIHVQIDSRLDGNSVAQDRHYSLFLSLSAKYSKKAVLMAFSTQVQFAPQPWIDAI